MPSTRRVREGDHFHAADRPATAEPWSGRLEGPVAVVIDFKAMTVDDYEQMTEQLDLLREGTAPSSRLYHWMRVYPDGVRVIEIWQELDSFGSFLEGTVRPVLRSRSLSEPKLAFHPIPNYLTDYDV